MQIENKINGGVCLLNALTFVQCLHSTVWMAGTKNSFVGDTREITIFYAEMVQDFSRISWHPKLHSERSRCTGKESILELILKTPARQLSLQTQLNSFSDLDLLLSAPCLSSKWLLALKSLVPSRKWAWKVQSTSNLTTNKEKIFFAMIRQTESHTGHLFRAKSRMRKGLQMQR